MLCLGVKEKEKIFYSGSGPVTQVITATVDVITGTLLFFISKLE
jgi:hypothetical protein